MYIPVCSLVIHFPLFYCHWTSGMSDSGCSSLGCKISCILENNHTMVETAGKTVLLVLVVWRDQFYIWNGSVLMSCTLSLLMLLRTSCNNEKCWVIFALMFSPGEWKLKQLPSFHVIFRGIIQVSCRTSEGCSVFKSMFYSLVTSNPINKHWNPDISMIPADNSKFNNGT